MDKHLNILKQLLIYHLTKREEHIMLAGLKSNANYRTWVMRQYIMDYLK